MSYKIISKFIKDISFEIPDAKAFVMLEKEISNYLLNFDIKSQPYKENIIEVNTIDDKSLMSRNTLTLKSCTSVAMVVNT